MAELLSPGVSFTIKDSSYYTSTSSSSIIGLVGGATRGPLTPTLITSRDEAIKTFGTPTTDDFGVYSLLGALTQSNNVYYRRVVKESSYATAGDPKTDRLLFESRDEDSMYNNVGIKIEIDPNKVPDKVGTVEVGTLSEEDLNQFFTAKKRVRDLIGDNYSVQLVGDHFYIQGIIEYRDDLEGLNPDEYMGTGYWMVLPLEDETDPTITYYTLKGIPKQCTIGQTDDGEHRTILLLEVDPENLDSYVLNIGGNEYKIIDRFAYLRGQAAPPKFNNDQDKFFTVTVRYADTSEVYENCTLANVEDKINDISIYVYVDVNPDESIFLRNSIFNMTGGGRGASFATSPEDEVINFATRSYDSTMNGSTVIIGEQDWYGTFNVSVLDPTGNQLEVLTSLSLDPKNARYFEDFINNNSSYIQCSYTESSEEDVTGRTFKLTGGEDGIDGLADQEIIAGLDSFSNIDLTDVDILCAPGWSDRTVIDKGIRVCEDRQDCIFLIDPPFGLQARQVVDWSNAQGDFTSANYAPFDSSYAAVYWPWVQIFDRDNKTYVWLPPSGYVAAQMAYSDSVSRQWYAPAGLARGVITGVTAIEYSPTKEERDLLYGNRNIVNPIMSYRGQGLVIWGQKTTQRTPTALDRVNVRRLVNYIKRVVTNLSGQFIFDMNDTHTWEKWNLAVDPILRNIQAERGLYAYEVVMDATTVTQEDIDNNRMPGIIRVRPTKTAEFIPITFELVANNVLTSSSNTYNNSTTTILAS